jgi:hypothetical protein
MTKRKDAQPDTDLTEPAPLADPPPQPADPDPIPSNPDEAGERVEDPVAPPLAPLPAPPQRSGILAPLLGGALAAIGGFTVSHFDLLGLAAPDNSAEIATLTARLDEAQATEASALDQISGRMAGLDARLTALEAAPPAPQPDLARLDDLEQRLADIEAMPSDGAASTAALTAKLADLDRRLTALPAAAPSTDIQQQLDDALARLEAAETAANARAAEAEAAAEAGRRAEALDALTTAITAGRPFSAELQALADPSLTDALGPFSETGVPTLATLQADFPAAARDALSLARDISAEDGWSDRLVDFLAAQTGARSVTPREGTTPDAILSRAEFALSEGRVADALAELSPLDDAVKAELSAWTSAATAYVTATAALQTARGE